MMEFCVQVGYDKNSGYPLYLIDVVNETPILSTHDAAIFHDRETAEKNAWLYRGRVCEVKS